MLINTFKHEFKKKAGMFITNDVILFRHPLELYDYAHNEVIATFEGRDIDPSLNYNIGGKTVKDIISRRASVCELHR